MPKIYISIGSNQDAVRQVRYGVEQLRYHFTGLQLSTVYESEAVGFEGDNFLNLVAAADTQMTISQVEQAFKHIEKSAGRIRGAKKFSNRTLDIDLLLYDNIVCERPVRLPRGEVLYHAFVLLPLAEIAGELKHPVVHETYDALWQEFKRKESEQKEPQNLWPITFEWDNEAKGINSD